MRQYKYVYIFVYSFVYSLATFILFIYIFHICYNTYYMCYEFIMHIYLFPIHNNIPYDTFAAINLFHSIILTYFSMLLSDISVSVKINAGLKTLDNIKYFILLL